MSWLKIGILASVIFGLYYFQQIKITLKSRGYDVEMFTGWLADYRTFKEMLKNETDPQLKVKYQGILNGLHMAFTGLVVITLVLLFGN